MPARPPVAFYCVSGRDFFPGAVALLNSLRLHGHGAPMFVLDCGLEPGQRRRLESHAEVLTATTDAPPSLLKLVAPMTRPAKVMVLLDADVIVTRPLTELIKTAADGRLVAFENESRRFFPEWGELLALGPVRRGPYLTSSALFVGGGLAADLMPLVQERLERIAIDGTWLAGGTEEDPLFYADQDVLNAVALSRLESDQTVTVEQRLAAIPPFVGIRVVDEGRLHCRYADGAEPYLLHHYYRKPWLVRLRSNPYSRLLTRALLGSEVPLRLDEHELPLRLRTGPGAGAARLATDVLVGAPAAVRRRIGGRPRKIKAWRDVPSAGGGPGAR
jgi:hypothetical protein